jgi:hypothetical protein
MPDALQTIQDDSSRNRNKTRRLRRLLSVIDSELDISKHRDLLRQVALIRPHSIRILVSAEGLDRYNCYMHALDMVGCFGEEDPYTPFRGEFYVNSKFVRYLLNGGHLRKTRKARKGKLAIYFENGVIRHIGCVSKGGRIVSKWGGCGNLYEHRPREVPMMYGNRIRYYEPISGDDAVGLFEKFQGH